MLACGRPRHFQTIFQEKLKTFLKVTLRPWYSLWGIWKSKRGYQGTQWMNRPPSPRKQQYLVVTAQRPGASTWRRADAASPGQHHGQKNPPLATLILNMVHPPQKQDRACPGVPWTGRHTQGLLIQPFYLDGDQGSIPRLGRCLERGMAIHSSILAWRIPWTEKTDYSSWCRKELDMTEQLTHTHTHTHTHTPGWKTHHLRGSSSK